MTDKIKTPNYSPEQEAALVAAAPITWDMAQEFATDFGKSVKSIIAKVKTLDLDYVPKAKPAPKRVGPTKSEMVAEIEAATGLVLTGLDKAPVAALKALARYVG